MSDQLDMYVDGVIYSHWNTIDIVKDIEAVSGAYNITLDAVSVFRFVDGKAVRIEIAKKPVITGYIESVVFTGEPGKYEIALSGRDKTGDIIDCSAVTTTSEFLNISFKSLAEKLCSPFGIKVTSKTEKAKKKLSKVSLQHGSVFEELERESRKVGVFLFPDPNGDLVIDEIGSETLTTRLTMPGNVIKIGSSIDTSQRFSEYRVKGQQGSTGTLTPKQQTQVSAKAKDENIERYRPLIIVAESGMGSAQAKERVEWEAAVRAGRSEELKVFINGWTDEGAALWTVNKIVSVKIDDIQFEDKMLIKRVAFRYNETDGQSTELTLSYPEAYIAKPVVPKKTGSSRILPTS